jgi:hypothetical protein
MNQNDATVNPEAPFEKFKSTFNPTKDTTEEDAWEKFSKGFRELTYDLNKKYRGSGTPKEFYSMLAQAYGILLHQRPSLAQRIAKESKGVGVTELMIIARKYYFKKQTAP